MSFCGPYDFYCAKGLVSAEIGLAPTAGYHPQAADAPADTNPLSAMVYVQSTLMYLRAALPMDQPYWRQVASA
jgi:hypothetical protein